MTKNRASQAARNPDVFLRISHTLVKTLKPYSHQIFVAGLIFFVGAIGIAAWNFVQHRQELKAQSKYIQAEKNYIKKISETMNLENKIKGLESELESVKKSKNKKLSKKSSRSLDEIQKDLKESQKKLDDLNNDSNTLAEGFKKVIEVYPKTQAAIMASLYLSQIYAKEKKTSEAIAVLTNPNLNYHEGKLLYGLAHMKLAQLYELSGQCQKSVETWAKILASPELNYFHPEATLASAVCYETLRNFDKARQLYKKTQVDFQNSPASQNARKYLFLMSLKGKDS